MIGKGSYGSVYKVERDNPTLGKEYAAVKMISIPKSEEEISALKADGMSENSIVTYYDNITKNFVKEIQMMTQFKGLNNIVSIEDHKVFKKPDGIGSDIFIRMELLYTMEQYTENHSMTQEDVIKLGCDICGALEKCSKLSIIHRDIKPANIFVNQFGDFKLGDFGIARTLSDTTSGLSLRGTFDYMAPEVYNGTHYDSRVDIYSLGIVLYKYLNHGFMPFISCEEQLADPAVRTEAFNRRMRGEMIPSPALACPELQKIILKACAYRPQDRFSSAKELHQALDRVRAGRPADVPAPQVMQPNSEVYTQVANYAVLANVPEPVKKRSKKKIIIAISSLVFVLAIGTGVTMWLINRNSKDKDLSSKTTRSNRLGVAKNETNEKSAGDLGDVEFVLTENYVTITFDGYEEYGKAKAEVNWALLESEVKKAKPDVDFSELKKCIHEGNLDPSQELKTDDIVKYEWICDSGLAHKNCGVILDTSNTVRRKVEGLSPVTAFDPFDGKTVLFTGENGKGHAELTGIPTNPVANNFTYTLSKEENLSNGEEITVLYNWSDDQDAAFVEKYGCKPSSTRWTVTVKGLSETDLQPESQMKLMKEYSSNLIGEMLTSSSYDVEPEYLGSIFLSPKNNPGEKPSHVCLVYRAWVDEETGDKNLKMRCPFYYCIAFHAVLADGTVDLSKSTVFGDSSMKKMKGYRSFESLFDKVVTANENDYDPDLRDLNIFVEDLLKTDGLLFPDCDENIIDDITISNMSYDELRQAINDIWAKYGYAFSNDKILAHYNQFSWYKNIDPKITPKTWNANGYEKDYSNYITDYEDYENYKKLKQERDTRPEYKSE